MRSNLNYKPHFGDWIFHWNQFRKQWEAVKREHYTELFSGGTNVLRADDFDTLSEVVNKKLYKTIK